VGAVQHGQPQRLLLRGPERPRCRRAGGGAAPGPHRAGGRRGARPRVPRRRPAPAARHLHPDRRRGRASPLRVRGPRGGSTARGAATSEASTTVWGRACTAGTTTSRARCGT
jgi:hypothetical protein